MLWLVVASCVCSLIAAVAAMVAVGRVDRLVRAFERAAAAESAGPQLPVTACLHAPEQRTDVSTMGREKWMCDPRKGGCGFEVNRERQRAHAGATT